MLKMFHIAIWSICLGLKLNDVVTGARQTVFPGEGEPVATGGAGICAGSGPHGTGRGVRGATPSRGGGADTAACRQQSTEGEPKPTVPVGGQDTGADIPDLSGLR